MASWRLGRRFSEATKLKMSLAKKGKVPANVARGDFTGSNAPWWKGESVSYEGLHIWVNKQKTDPGFCEVCAKTDCRLEWANVDGSYRRNLDDYARMCVSCHRTYDMTDEKRASLKERGKRTGFKKGNQLARQYYEILATR